MTEFLTILGLGIIIGVLLYRSWTNHVMAQTVAMIEQEAGKSLDQLYQDQLDAATKFRIVTCRKYQQQWLLYDRDTDEFLTQGTDLEHIHSQLKRQLGAQQFTIWFDLDEPAVATDASGT